MAEPSRQMTSLIDLLDQLALPAEPTPVSLLPQTWGWAVLALLLLGLIGWALWAWERHRRANHYRRTALDLLANCHDDPAQIAEILRRTALAAYPRTTVASLAGQDWLRFLDRSAKGAEFASKGADLAIAPYRKTPADPALTRMARDWVRHHRRELQP